MLSPGATTDGIQIHVDAFNEKLQDAKDRRFIDYIQNEGIPIPSLEEMEEDLQKMNDLPELENRIQALKKEHEGNINRLFNQHAWEYEQETLHRYQSLSIEEMLGPEATPEAEEELMERCDALFNAMNKQRQRRWQDEINSERLAYLERIRPLLEQKKRLTGPGASSISTAPFQSPVASFLPVTFPQSEAEFNALLPAAQQCVAQFLSDSTPSAKKNEILSEQRWGDSIKTLKNLYVTNPLFKSEIEAQLLAGQIQAPSRDPRKRASASLF